MPRQQDDLSGVEGPGVSQPKIKAVEDCFEALLNARTNRMKWGTKEKDAQIASLSEQVTSLSNEDVTPSISEQVTLLEAAYDNLAKKHNRLIERVATPLSSKTISSVSPSSTL